MKNLLTIVVYCNSDTGSTTLYDGIELIYPVDREPEAEFTSRAIKEACGKYIVLLGQKFKFADVSPLLNILDKNSPDMVTFTGGTAIKASIVKSAAKHSTDIFSSIILSILDCKSVLKSNYTPFIFEKSEAIFTETNYNGLLTAAKEFIAMKAKLSKDVYSLVMNALCQRLVIFYLTAMLGIKNGEIKSETLIEFDSKLKGEIVLFLALEKNFTYAKLTKLRKKDFKISALRAMKFKKALKSQ